MLIKASVAGCAKQRLHIQFLKYRFRLFHESSVASLLFPSAKPFVSHLAIILHRQWLIVHFVLYVQKAKPLNRFLSVLSFWLTEAVKYAIAPRPFQNVILRLKPENNSNAVGP